MGRVKDVLMSVLQCSQCEGQGWENLNGYDEPCDCNPYEIPRDVIAEWNILED
jgi:hypothetical protein